VISQPTDGLLSPRWHLPLAFITTEGRCKNNGEKLFCFYDVSVVLLTIFSIKMLFSGYRAIRDIAAHRRILAKPMLPTAPVYSHRATMQKIMVRNYCVLTMFQLFRLPFFQLK
jgi:hypothetical protein